jgi:hypothetical protein
MKIQHFCKLTSIKTSLKFIAATSLLTSIVSTMTAAPAQAVRFDTIPNSELSFGVSTSSFSGNVNPSAPGNTFSVTFDPNLQARIIVATGSFAPTFASNTDVASSNPTVTFTNQGGSVYGLNQDLNILLGAATTFTIGQNSKFTETDILNSGGTKVGAGLQLSTAVGTKFVNGGDTTNVPTLSFSFNDTGLPSGGLYISQSSPTSVPEPLTIVGTIVGGFTALRMRNKLKATKD